MSAQLEFIMQLYMMNLLQQQQQQLQQQQPQQQIAQTQSPTKQMDNKSGNTSLNSTIAATTVQRPQKLQKRKQQQEQQQQQKQNTRTQKRLHSQNTNCSSSRSCSPNSNSSPITTNSLAQNQLLQLQQQQQQQSLQQPMLLLNNFSPLTQLLLEQQQQQQHHLLTAPSNVLLTPVTPNSNFSKAPILADSHLSNSSNIGCNNSGSFSNSNSFSSLPSFTLPSYQHTTPNIANISFTAQNFLQSSTVTSTPTEEKCPVNVEQGDDNDAALLMQQVSTIDVDKRQQQQQQPKYDDDIDEGNDVVFSTSEQQSYDDRGFSTDSRSSRRAGKQCSNATDDNDTNDNNDDEDDDLPLSSLQTSSSGIVSSCTTSGEDSRKLLLSSGLQCLESSSTMDETNTVEGMMQLPYTPIKQEADSSLSCTSTKKQPLTPCNKNSTASCLGLQFTANSTLNEDSNMTPLALAANAILTPPSSEQLVVNQYDITTQSTTSISATGATATASTNLSLTTASSLDAFLQNEENLKNLKKFGSYLECENLLCRQENLREHFHCYDEPCKGKILSKKDDIIRHLKWHKKRKESLLLGFARFSSADDCEPTYGAGCAYNWKQTHYHCVYDECPKVYVSTSDVQMHANFHRKNSEIVQEGFRRFRAHENCKILDCPFYGKKISHYHCCREGCNHTFKNKADMDKHKSYHLKDYQLTQDGFKKILKTENCPFDGCKFSTVSNHIHCVRENCNYILHSSSQMISHKRKHDRADSEQAYQSFKKEKKDSSEDESPTTTQQVATGSVSHASCTSNNMTTPLSSHSTAEQFLSRKRGRPPKMIQLPAADSNNTEMKRLKLELSTDPQQQQQQLLNLASSLPTTSNMFSPFLSNFNPAVAAAVQQSMQLQDPNAASNSNFQLTHLMALFQLQNPLFYQNLYPGGVASMLAAGTTPQNASMFGNLSAFNAAAAEAATAATAHVKTEVYDKQQYKE